MTPRWIFSVASFLLATALTPFSAADPYPTDRDRILSEADTYYNLEWYCSEDNIYNDISGCTCAYSNPQDIGWQQGAAYQWGGEDTIDEYLSLIASGAGAGDVNSSYADSSGAVTGVDCSGFVSRIWESGRYATRTFYLGSDEIDREDLRMGDAVNKSGSHIRLFIRWESPAEIWVYEATTGIYDRVIQRSLNYPTTSSYVPIRYHRTDTNRVRIDPEPTIQWISETSPGAIWMPFDGEADNGFRVQHSTDGNTWNTVRDETTLGSAAFRADLTGLAARVEHFFRVIAVNASGPTEPSDAMAYRQGSASNLRVLIVDGMDRWRSDGNTGHTFLVRVAQSLGRLGFNFVSCSNEMVAVGMVDLTDFDHVIWLVGEDSTNDESISRGEQWHVENYLEQGGDLFLSGSEIAWDLSHSGSGARFQDPTDGPFMRDYLKIDFDSDGSSGNGYLARGESGSLLSGNDIHFGDGTHGTYDVDYPDSFTPQAGGEVWLRYPSNGEAAMVSWEGQFGSTTETGRVTVMGFGLETVWDDDERDAILSAVFGLTPAVSPMGFVVR